MLLCVWHSNKHLAATTPLATPLTYLKPSGWYYILDATRANTFISQAGNRSGQFGLKFVGGGSGNFGIMQPDLKTVPGRTYTFSAYIRVVNAPSVTVRLGFWNEYLNQEGEIKNSNFSGTQDWTRISLTTTTPGLITDPKNEFPLLEIVGLTTGTVYVNSIQLHTSVIKNVGVD